MSDHGENKFTIANSVVGHVSFSMVAPKLNRRLCIFKVARIIKTCLL